jgi:hypothetical protein
MSLAAHPGILQDDQASLVIDDSPLLDLLDGSKTPEARIIIVEATISYAG